MVNSCADSGTIPGLFRTYSGNMPGPDRNRSETGPGIFSGFVHEWTTLFHGAISTLGLPTVRQKLCFHKIQGARSTWDPPVQVAKVRLESHSSRTRL